MATRHPILAAGLVSVVVVGAVSTLQVTAQRQPQQGDLQGGTIPRRRMAVRLLETLHPGVLTYHNDWGRTGANLQEATLTPDTVSPRQFGLLKTDFRVDGTIRAQPLYVPDVSITGTLYNVVIVVTDNDTVYAFDADVNEHPENWASPLWARHVLDEGETPVPTADQVDDDGSVCADVSPQIGITSTPVVDPSTGTLFVVAKAKEANEEYAYTLHASWRSTPRRDPPSAASGPAAPLLRSTAMRASSLPQPTVFTIRDWVGGATPF
jgi:hypothetical protein